MSSFTHPFSRFTHSTVRIEVTDSTGTPSSGSGYVFFFCMEGERGIPCIVTNRHVIGQAVRGVFHLTKKKSDGTPDLGNYEEIIINDLGQFCILHPNPEIDLAAIPIGIITNKAEKQGESFYINAISINDLATPDLLEQLSPIEEVVMIGYPNGLWDKAHNLPIARKGITATHPKLKLNNKPEFLIDAACFPGSSGSPVFLANIGSYLDLQGALCIDTRVALLGTLYAGPQIHTTGEVVTIDVPSDTKEISVGMIPMNLGYVIQASELLPLEKEVKKQLHQPGTFKRNGRCLCGSGKRYKECCGILW